MPVDHQVSLVVEVAVEPVQEALSVGLAHTRGGRSRLLRQEQLRGADIGSKSGDVVQFIDGVGVREPARMVLMVTLKGSRNRGSWRLLQS